VEDLEIRSYHCQEIYVGVTHVRATTKITSLKHRMFMTERECTKCFGTYKNTYYTDEVGLTEECLQQNIISFMFVKNTLLIVKTKLLSTSTTTNINKILHHLCKADPK
jgi:hypothetical protein